MKSLGFTATRMAVVAASSLSVALQSPSAPAMSVAHSEARNPVLVELFTSEGCSSCPPADKLLAQLQRDQAVNGALIIPLSEHVDYWDGPHWRDQYSSPTFTARQEEYVKALRVSSPYTPQMVVDGRTEFVGSDGSASLSAISLASKRRKAVIAIKAKEDDRSDLGVDIDIKSPFGLGNGGASDVFVAITEDNLSSHVLGGENSGRKLEHTAVVRSLQRVGSISGAEPFLFTGKLRLSRSWKDKDLAVVAFIQSRGDRQIFGSAIVKPSRVQ